MSWSHKARVAVCRELVFAIERIMRAAAQA